MRKMISIFLVFIIILIGFLNLINISSSFVEGNGIADSPWPCLGGNSRRTGLSEYDTSHVDGGVKWKISLGKSEFVESSPIIGQNDVIYMGSDDNMLLAIDQNGKLKWKFNTNGGVWSTPAISEDGTVYFSSLDHNLYAVNSDGTERWRFDTKGQIYSSPVIGNDGTIYIGSNNEYLYAINPNGTEKWKFFLNCSYIPISPAVDTDGTIYMSSHHNLYAINPNGSEKWVFEGMDWFNSPSIDKNGVVYVGSDDHNLYAINSNGTIKWKFQTGNSISNSPPAIGNNGTIYVGSHDNNLYAINPDGTLKWKYKTNNWIESSPSIGSDDTIYFGSWDGFVYALNNDGSLKWKYNTYLLVKSSPAIGSDGTIYIASENGYLYAFGKSTLSNILLPLLPIFAIPLFIGVVWWWSRREKVPKSIFLATLLFIISGVYYGNTIYQILSSNLTSIFLIMFIISFIHVINSIGIIISLLLGRKKSYKGALSLCGLGIIASIVIIFFYPAIKVAAISISTLFLYTIVGWCISNKWNQYFDYKKNGDGKLECYGNYEPETHYCIICDYKEECEKDS